jgi:hypothetical protein
VAKTHKWGDGEGDGESGWLRVISPIRALNLPNCPFYLNIHTLIHQWYGWHSCTPMQFDHQYTALAQAAYSCYFYMVTCSQLLLSSLASFTMGCSLLGWMFWHKTLLKQTSRLFDAVYVMLAASLSYRKPVTLATGSTGHHYCL